MRVNISEHRMAQAISGHPRPETAGPRISENVFKRENVAICCPQLRKEFPTNPDKSRASKRAHFISCHLISVQREGSTMNICERREHM